MTPQAPVPGREATGNKTRRQVLRCLRAVVDNVVASNITVVQISATMPAGATPRIHWGDDTQSGASDASAIRKSMADLWGKPILLQSRVMAEKATQTLFINLPKYLPCLALPC